MVCRSTNETFKCCRIWTSLCSFMAVHVNSLYLMISSFVFFKVKSVISMPLLSSNRTTKITVLKSILTSRKLVRLPSLNYLIYLLSYFHRRKSWWQNCHICVNYPYKCLGFHRFLSFIFVMKFKVFLLFQSQGLPQTRQRQIRASNVSILTPFHSISLTKSFQWRLNLHHILNTHGLSLS